MRPKAAEAFREHVAALGIVATADTCAGEPRIDGRRITVELLAKRFRSGEAMAEIARDYELTVLQVENAIRFWMLPRSSRRQWHAEAVPAVVDGPQVVFHEGQDAEAIEQLVRNNAAILAEREDDEITV